MNLSIKNSRFYHKLASQPVSRLQIIGFIAVAILPILFLSISIYRIAWDNEWREIKEKHQLLAMNLASPVSHYVDSHLDMLSVLADEVNSRSQEKLEDVNMQQSAYSAFKNFKGFRCISLVDITGKVLFIVNDDEGMQEKGLMDLSRDESFTSALSSRKPQISGIRSSPVDNKPTILLSHPIFNMQKILIGVFLAELKIDKIEELRRSIRFGEKGHSAIVDASGHVIAHPNPAWMKEMRDLSHLSVVKEMMAGNSGVIEFYSPFAKQDMVAGYASVSGIGWGIMVPQPKSEVEAQVHSLLKSHVIWGLIGLVLAIILAITLVNWITRPINLLSRAARRLSQNAYDGELPKITSSAPRELIHLGDGLRNLIEGLQASRNEVNQMNETLQRRVEDSTKELREANSELNRIASSDYLTSLSSRRYFEEKLNLDLGRRRTDNDDLSLLLIDLDNFKEVNDQYGHSAGDAVLVQIANLLNSKMNDGDILARYGGDEIVAKLGCDANTALSRAEDIRKAVYEHKFVWNNIPIHMTVSIGVLYCTNYRSDDFNMLLNKVDIALYEAKKTGRNTVVEFKMKTEQHKGAEICSLGQ